MVPGRLRASGGGDGALNPVLHSSAVHRGIGRVLGRNNVWDPKVAGLEGPGRVESVHEGRVPNPDPEKFRGRAGVFDDQRAGLESMAAVEPKTLRESGATEAMRGDKPSGQSEERGGESWATLGGCGCWV